MFVKGRWIEKNCDRECLTITIPSDGAPYYSCGKDKFRIIKEFNESWPQDPFNFTCDTPQWCPKLME
jgi:hypothetical protein